jgi:hypothetical protein
MPTHCDPVYGSDGSTASDGHLMHRALAANNPNMQLMSVYLGDAEQLPTLAGPVIIAENNEANLARAQTPSVLEIECNALHRSQLSSDQPNAVSNRAIVGCLQIRPNATTIYSIRAVHIS